MLDMDETFHSCQSRCETSVNQRPDVVGEDGMRMKRNQSTPQTSHSCRIQPPSAYGIDRYV
jgi:hypothetical protein